MSKNCYADGHVSKMKNYMRYVIRKIDLKKSISNHNTWYDPYYPSMKAQIAFMPWAQKYLILDWHCFLESRLIVLCWNLSREKEYLVIFWNYFDNFDKWNRIF